MFIYRFINQYNQVIYVGRTDNLVRRFRYQHFTDKGHLSQECYQETDKVEYAKVSNKNESKVYELFYIERYQPKYNDKDIGGGKLSFDMPELEWKEFNVNENTKLKRITKKELADTLEDLGEVLETECRYMRNFLRDKDQVSWINKLEVDERNGYLMMIYSLERFVNGIEDIKEEYVGKIKSDRKIREV